MKAIRYENFGGPEVLHYADIDKPRPAAGEALVRVEAAGVNFIDTYQRTGLYPVPLPATPGSEAAGVVVELGPGVSSVRVGERVAWTGVRGAYAGFACVPHDRLVPLPDDISARQGAAAMLQGMTAHYLTRDTFALARGHTCLIHAAAGGVGLLLCQMARAAGARAIGTASTPEKAGLALAAGADEVILYTRDDFEAEVRALTGGRGVDVVYDSVGQATFDRSLRCLRPRGMLVLFGQSSGSVPPVDPQILNRHGSLFLTRPTLHHHIATRDELLARAADVLGAVASGDLILRIGLEMPLAAAADAHRALEARRTTGKVLLIPDD